MGARGRGEAVLGKCAVVLGVGAGGLGLGLFLLGKEGASLVMSPH